MFSKVAIEAGTHLPVNTISSFNICLTDIKTVSLVKSAFWREGLVKRRLGPKPEILSKTESSLYLFLFPVSPLGGQVVHSLNLTGKSRTGFPPEPTRQGRAGEGKHKTYKISENKAQGKECKVRPLSLCVF